MQIDLTSNNSFYPKIRRIILIIFAFQWPVFLTIVPEARVTGCMMLKLIGTSNAPFNDESVRKYESFFKLLIT